MIRRLMTALCCVLVLSLASCSSSTEGGEEPEATTSAGAPATPGDGAETPGGGEESGDPSSGETDGFTFEDAATFDDGVSLEVAFTLADKAKETDTGAEGTNGEIVVVVLKLSNESEEEYDASDALVTATYGAEDKEAEIIVDETGELATGFAGVIATGEEQNAQLGFAIPAAESGDITITVDLNDAVHDPVSFSGAAAKS